jgi:hypothetical protein
VAVCWLPPHALLTYVRAASLSIGARFPDLLTIGIATLGSGLLILLLSSGALYVVARRRR